MSKPEKSLLAVMLLVLDVVSSNLIVHLIFRSVELTLIKQIVVTVGITAIITLLLISLALWVFKKRDEMAAEEDEDTEAELMPGSYSGRLGHSDGLPLLTVIHYDNALYPPQITKNEGSYIIEFGNGTVKISSFGAISISKGHNLKVKVVSRGGYVDMS